MKQYMKPETMVVELSSENLMILTCSDPEGGLQSNYGSDSFDNEDGFLKGGARSRY